MKQNPLLEKSFDFSLNAIRTFNLLLVQGVERHLALQFMRSATSVGALVREAQHAESRKDFIHKLSIAQKECNEASYWLELIYKSHAGIPDFESLLSHADELSRILTSSIRTTKTRLSNTH